MANPVLTDKSFERAIDITMEKLEYDKPDEGAASA